MALDKGVGIDYGNVGQAVEEGSKGGKTGATVIV